MKESWYNILAQAYNPARSVKTDSFPYPHPDTVITSTSSIKTLTIFNVCG